MMRIASCLRAFVRAKSTAHEGVETRSLARLPPLRSQLFEGRIKKGIHPHGEPTTAGSCSVCRSIGMNARTQLRFILTCPRPGKANMADTVRLPAVRDLPCHIGRRGAGLAQACDALTEVQADVVRG